MRKNNRSIGANAALALLVATAALGCALPQKRGGTTAAPQTAEQNKAVVRNFYQVFSTGNVADILALMRDDATYWVSGSVQGFSGVKTKAQLAEALAGVDKLYVGGALSARTDHTDRRGRVGVRRSVGTGRAQEWPRLRTPLRLGVPRRGRAHCGDQGVHRHQALLRGLSRALTLPHFLENGELIVFLLVSESQVRVLSRELRHFAAYGALLFQGRDSGSPTADATRRAFPPGRSGDGCLGPLWVDFGVFVPIFGSLRGRLARGPPWSALFSHHRVAGSSPASGAAQNGGRQSALFSSRSRNTAFFVRVS